MKLASLLLPNPNFAEAEKAEWLNHAAKWVEDTLLDNFGGYTKSEVSGAWRDENGKTHYDFSTRYEVAFPVDHNSASYRPALFKDIATMAAIKAHELAVFFVYDGEAYVQAIGPAALSAA